MHKKSLEKKKIMNYTGCSYKSQNCAQSQRNFARLYCGETVTFRNSAGDLSLLPFPQFNNVDTIKAAPGGLLLEGGL